MNILRSPLTLCAAAFVALGTLSHTALAGLTTYTADMAGFTYNSDFASSAFNTALGAGYTHIIFDGATSNDGTSYSSDVTFSTIQTSNGGITGGLVNENGAEIGPYDEWYGGFDIDFNGGPVTTVGFGLVDPASITVYDTAGDSLGTFSSDEETFSLWGVQATGGEEIGSVVLDGDFYAIQDIEFSNAQVGSSVPDGGTTVEMLGGAIFALAALRRRIQK
jgi:hypothetical protein